MKKASPQLSIRYYTLFEWRSKRKITIKIKTLKYQSSDEELKQRNLEIERENAELRKANDILNDPLVLLGKTRKRENK